MDEYQRNRTDLTESLREFIDDFKTWPVDDKLKIQISGLCFIIKDLDEIKQSN